MIFLDISANNGGPRDFAAVKAAGVDGVICKATQGDYYVSEVFGSDYFAAMRAGLIVGAYHFWDPRVDDQAQREWFVQHYGPRKGLDFPACWDVEYLPGARDESAQLAHAVARTQANLDWLAATYGDAWAYLNRSWAAQVRVQNHGVWLAQGTVGPCARAEAMQFAPTTIPGLSGLTDWSVTDWRPSA